MNRDIVPTRLEANVYRIECSKIKLPFSTDITLTCSTIIAAKSISKAIVPNKVRKITVDSDTRHCGDTAYRNLTNKFVSDR